MKIVLEGNRVLVRPDKLEEKTEAGIIMPVQARDVEDRGASKGTFLAAGPNADLFFEGEREIKKGERVAFVQYAGVSIQHEGEDLWIMSDQDLLCIIDD